MRKPLRIHVSCGLLTVRSSEKQKMLINPSGNSYREVQLKQATHLFQPVHFCDRKLTHFRVFGKVLCTRREILASKQDIKSRTIAAIFLKKSKVILQAGKHVPFHSVFKVIQFQYQLQLDSEIEISYILRLKSVLCRFSSYQGRNL